jgi:hypothetical protein
MLKEDKEMLFDSIALILSCITIILFWQNTVLTTVILLILIICTFIYNSKQDKIYFIIVAIAATIVESITIITGAWIYSTQNIASVPIWIPLYWGLGAITMKNIYLIIKKKIK